MTYDLPNPFMRLSVVGIPTSDREAAALEPDEPAHGDGGAAAEPVDSYRVGYRCCDDCGAREPCDQYCPQAGVWCEPIPFTPDWAALEAEIEPVPAFLTDNRAEQIEELLELARAEDWPAPRRMVG